MITGPSLETIYLREKLHGLKDIFTYLPDPKDDSYLMRRQQGLLEGMAESYGRLKPTQNISYGRTVATGAYDIASTLGLYNPKNSVSYFPKRSHYDKDDNDYSA